MNPAKSARLDKEARPSAYCQVTPACLWNEERGGPCGKHKPDAERCGEYHPRRPILSCVLAAGHEGPHNTRYQTPWPQTEDVSA